MRKIKFLETCFVAAVRYEANTIVNEDALPAEWLKGALRLKYVAVTTDDPSTKVPPDSSNPPKPPAPPAPAPKPPTPAPTPPTDKPPAAN